MYYGTVLIRQRGDSVKTHFQVHYYRKLLPLKHLKQISDTLIKITKKILLWKSYSPDGTEIWNITIKLHVYKAHEQKDYNINEFYFSPSLFKVYFSKPASHF